MSDLYGSQGIGCNVGSCSYFKNNQCTLQNIQIGASTNMSTGIAEDETLCLSYKRRDVHKEDRAEHIKRFGLHN
jgi:hypothetical protein